MSQTGCGANLSGMYASVANTCPAGRGTALVSIAVLDTRLTDCIIVAKGIVVARRTEIFARKTGATRMLKGGARLAVQQRAVRSKATQHNRWVIRNGCHCLYNLISQCSIIQNRFKDISQGSCVEQTRIYGDSICQGIIGSEPIICRHEAG